MTVLLRHGGAPVTPESYDFWFPTTDSGHPLPDHRKWPDVARRLEAAYDRCAETCWEIGLELARTPGAEIARTPTMGAYGTDFRLMLAWVELAAELADAPERFVMICDDPWLFREIAARPGISAGAAPPLWRRRLAFRLRGWLARTRNAGRLAATATRLRAQRRAIRRGSPSILAYGHPDSQPDGKDAYFGDLMTREPTLHRLLHTDCALPLARRLGSGDRTASLHAWGSALFALTLPVARWRPPRRPRSAAWYWLVERAVEVENGGAGPTMARWQMHCQDRWIADRRPTVVVWPWENFAWERALCRSARAAGIPAIGYQHTVVGKHQINFAARLNPDGRDSLPDRIVCNGPAYRDELLALGHDPDSLVIGGAFRVTKPAQIGRTDDAPVFFALSALLPVAREQLRAARCVAEMGIDVLVRDHPMYPVDLDETDRLRRAESGLLSQERLSAVVYSSGTSGLEAALAGVPTIRFLPDDRIAVQILPDGIELPFATLATIAALAQSPPAPTSVRWEDLFAPVDYGCWHALLAASARRAP